MTFGWRRRSRALVRLPLCATARSPSAYRTTIGWALRAPPPPAVEYYEVDLADVITSAEFVARLRAREDTAIQAQAEGIMNLRQSGIEKVRQGITSLEELNRVTRD